MLLTRCCNSTQESQSFRLPMLCLEPSIRLTYFIISGHSDKKSLVCFSITFFMGELSTNDSGKFWTNIVYEQLWQILLMSNQQLNDMVNYQKWKMCGKVQFYSWVKACGWWYTTVFVIFVSIVTIVTNLEKDNSCNCFNSLIKLSVVEIYMAPFLC